ncbi:hypothetical protein PF005_g28734 [Phytophthora fragariae]|uniref:Uncharacterized protein n=1 Tax=Phytophthora fragariae TaxID=53985 RepID=A0A6A3VKY0_9STRA|nr:hypothetical protein PF003_g39074 [Phytophthora fragariae]KAE8876865.1 hypothetical protein PF003_g39065 [Phytophthora fragariae]KAE8982641.1 hypothetical protein PF011_g21533 [Phytophthora fragariae]KAE9065093.1 hypothetical protein PF010_g28350 [Phytophthora fragariae]KAE9066033.1 hypothetical protein PF007_g28634 [Phytophthora fragariae]
MAAALQDLTAVVASIQAGDGRRTEPEGARRGEAGSGRRRSTVPTVERLGGVERLGQ